MIFVKKLFFIAFAMLFVFSVIFAADENRESVDTSRTARSSDVREADEERADDATSPAVASTERREERISVRETSESLETKNRKCGEMPDRAAGAVCNRQAVAYHAYQKALERHRLSEECRTLAGQNRSACEERVNRLFRIEIQDEFREWVRSRRNLTGIIENKTEERAARARIHEIQKERRNEQLNETKEGNRRRLINQLDNLLDSYQKHSEQMERAIGKAKEKGHDTRKLEFLHDKYDQVLDNAKTFFGEKQYRNLLTALKDAKNIFREFRQTFAEIVREQKLGEKYREALENETTSS